MQFRMIRIVLVALSAAVAAAQAHAQANYPTKPMRWVVPYTAVARMTASGSIPVGNTPEPFANDIKAEIARYAKVIKAHGIKAE